VSQNALDDFLMRIGSRLVTGDIRAILSHRIRRAADVGDQAPLLTSEWIEDFLSGNPILPSPGQQATNIIRVIGDTVLAAGKRLPQIPIWLRASAGSPNATFCADIVDQLRKSGHIDAHDGKNTSAPHALREITLTLIGWERHAAEKRGALSAGNGFIALKWGDPILDSFLHNVIKPAVTSIGYQLEDMRDSSRAGIIDNLMREKIRDAAFVLVDLTHENSGAYWEGGYAEGLGKPVIYLCNRFVFEAGRTHFDTNHCTTIKWDESSPAEFKADLVATLRRSLELFPAR
jgi:hypothetical protein